MLCPTRQGAGTTLWREGTQGAIRTECKRLRQGIAGRHVRHAFDRRSVPARPVHFSNKSQGGRPREPEDVAGRGDAINARA
eukprot:4472815-Prymnesium_polylepis.4